MIGCGVLLRLAMIVIRESTSKFLESVTALSKLVPLRQAESWLFVRSNVIENIWVVPRKSAELEFEVVIEVLSLATLPKKAELSFPRSSQPPSTQPP